MRLYNIIMLGLVGFVCSCCSDDVEDFGIEDTPVGELVPVQLSRSEAEASDLTDAFQYRLFNKVNACAQPNDNVLVSPLSARLVLSMFANGVDTQSQKEIVEALGCDDINSLNTLAGNLLASLPGVDRAGVQLGLSQSLWYDKGFTLKPEFTQMVNTFYTPDIFAINSFDSSACLREINAWCSQRTNGCIPEFLKSWNPTNAAFFNALYFKGTWKNKFDVAKTDRKSFYGTSGNTIVDMMHKDINGDVKVDERFIAGRVLFGNAVSECGFSVTFVLPQEGIDIEELATSFSSEDMKDFTKCYFDLSLPRMSLRPGNLNLEDPLKAMGIESIFSERVQNMFKETCKTKWEVEQGATVDFDENGAVVAVVSSVKGLTTAPMPTIDLNLNRPFLFFITESGTGACLMAGKVLNL